MVECQVKENSVVAVKPTGVQAYSLCSRAVYPGRDDAVQWMGNEKGREDWDHRGGLTRKGCGNRRARQKEIADLRLRWRGFSQG